MTRTVGSRIGPYEVVALIGAGGMGEVYRATDPRLCRDVAIKMLRDDDRLDPEQATRFEREARLLASLNHPNIATIHGIEELGNSRAIVMELVEGPSLAEMIAQGPLSVQSAAGIGGQIADGLASAHARGIIHRDLKPSNVLVTADERVKILDLGIAKMTAASYEPARIDGRGHRDGQTLETRTGMVVGTPGYMSPEQSVGEPVDARSDAWAFGAVLFEMLAGRSPFPGRSLQQIFVSVMQGAVEWGRLPADVPRDVRDLIQLCLDADVTRRLADLGRARDLLRSVRVSSVPGVLPEASATKSIVVLPFANLSPESDTEYFSDGLTDELITDLSRVRALRVISRSSAMRLKGDPRDLVTIGRDLACQYVLEGSIRRSAANLRITARLVDAVNDAQLWADKYGGVLDDVFDMQERVSRAIVDALEIHLSPQEVAGIAERPIEDARAHESYLRAQGEIWSFLPGSLDRAMTHLQAALQLLGDNALVYQAMGVAYFQYVNIGAALGREEEFLGKAERCADRIFALEPESPRGYIVRAHTHLARGEIHASGRCFRRALAAFPNEVAALQMYVHVLGWLVGKPASWPSLVTRLQALDPLGTISHLVCSMALLFAGRFADAVASARRMFALDSVTPVLRANLVMALVYNGELDEAEALTREVQAQPDSDVGTWQMGLFRAAWRSDRTEVMRLADGPQRQTAMWDAEVPWILAATHAKVGLTDEALFWLERAIDGGMINHPFFAEHDRFLDSLRGDSRFDHALARARRAWEAFES